MKIQSLRGFNDVLPEQSRHWRRLDDAFRATADAFGYEQVHLPVVEATELFRRSVGEATDIVEKEMFSFLDRDKTAMSLRPEGTAGCVRAGIEHGLLHNQQQRLWYTGAMFRHERPQAGRYRQFHQYGIEAFGMAGPACDVEAIALSADVWRRFGLPGLRLEINSLGSPECRMAYREELRAFLHARADRLDEDARKRIDSNPLRVLDSKHPETKAAVADAPEMAAMMSEESRAHFRQVCAGLDALGIAWEHNPRLVRGLDYYTHTVFEWITDALGAQGTVCAGGRYDGLVAQLGGGEVPAVGFALGVERLLLLAQQQEEAAGGEGTRQRGPQVYVCWMGDDCMTTAQTFGARLRAAGLRVIVHAGGGSFKAQFKRADRSGADWAVVLGPDEIASGSVQIKSMRTREEQQRMAQDEAIDRLVQHTQRGA